MSDPNEEDLDFGATKVTRYRITVRGHAGNPIELRGFCNDPALIRKIANAVEPDGVMVIMAPADTSYNPFSLDEL